MSRRRRDAPDDDEDERMETHEGEHRVPATQYGKGNAPDENEASQTQNTQKKKKQKRAPTDDSRHLEGSIVRVLMKNFLTYDDAEVFPGPHLNMLIGPNGTGKSSLVAAIIVGVGGEAKITGRFKELKEMIKRGKERASVEVELKKASGKNVVIRREWKRESNVSNFTLNGERANTKEVEECVKKFHIQVDNLCQVLPQDRVTEFAGMNAQELLRETQRAAGGEKMVNAHQKLMDLNKDVRALESQIATFEKEIEHDENRNRQVEAEVKKLQELETLKAQLDEVKLKILMKNYRIAYDRHEELQKESRSLKERKVELEKINAPLVTRKALLEAQVKEAKKLSHECTQEHNKDAKEIEHLTEKVEAVDDELGSLRKKIARFKETTKKTREELEQRRKELVKAERAEADALREYSGSGVPVNDGDVPSGPYKDLLDQMEELNAQLDKTDVEIKQLNISNDSNRATRLSLLAQEEEVGNELKKMEDIKEKRRDFLRQSDPDTYKAMQWIYNYGGQSELKEKPYDPIMVEVTATHERYGRVIENAIPFASWKTIGVKNEHDYKLLLKELVDKQRLRVNVALIDSNDNPSNYRSPLGSNDLRRLNLDVFVGDVLEAPDPIKAWLLKQHKLNSVPFSEKPLTPKQREAIDTKRTEDGKVFFQRFFIDNVSYVMYENGNSSRSNIMGEARWLRQAGNDDGRKLELESKRAEIQRRLSAMEPAEKEYQKKMAKLQQKGKGLEAQMIAFVAERKKMTSGKNRIEAARSKIREHEANIVRLENSIGKSIQQREDGIKDLNKMSELRIKSLRRIEGLVRRLVHTTLQNHTMAGLNELTYSAQFKVVDEELAAANEELAQVEKELEGKREFLRAAREVAKEAQEVLKEAKAKLSEEEQQRISADANDSTLEDLEEQEAIIKARINAGRNVDQGILDDYNRRKASLEQKKEAIATQKEDLDNKTQQMDAIRVQWYPKITELVQEINTNFVQHFQRIGSVGAVQLDEEGPYDQWGIKIMVKFRANENLNQLTKERQSGGERAVSTISYLMALQALIRVPFRMVDEINQGMDPRNERLVHGAFVDVSCDQDTAQYFLVTPKLLPDLKYSKKMRVLTVMNGDHLPQDEVDIGKILARKRALLGR